MPGENGHLDSYSMYSQLCGTFLPGSYIGDMLGENGHLDSYSMHV